MTTSMNETRSGGRGETHQMPSSLAKLERRCQKPDYRHVGNWMARRISRPAALRVTAVVAPWGVTANVATLAAWAVALAAACMLGWGTPAAWLSGAVLLQLWYLLDHVDGQLARLHGTASLDGAQLDYLMHHTVNLLVPIGAGFGLFVVTAEPWWLVAGVVWGTSLLLITLRHDACYRSFVARLQQLQGTLEVHGGADLGTTAVPADREPIYRVSVRLIGRLARKMCEIHVVMNLLSLVAIAEWLAGDVGLWAGRLFVAASTLVAMAIAFWSLARSQASGQCEQEFAARFRVPAEHELLYRNGCWVVGENRQAGGSGEGGWLEPDESY